MNYDTIIVGAGICGLSAAIELFEQRYKGRVLVLEAGDIPGGRAQSMVLPNGEIFNVGANWFHGGDENPFFQWANKRYDLGPLINDDKPESDKVFLSWKSGNLQEYRQVEKSLEAAYEKTSDKNVSLAHVAQAAGTPHAIEVMDFMASGWMAMDDATQVSAHEYFSDPLGPGGWQMKKGCGHLVEEMAAEIIRHGGEIRCGVKVTALNQPDNLIRVSCDAEPYSAENVIVTVSPGVLNDGSIKLDSETQKTVAQKIEGVQMGNLIKIVVCLRPAFFDDRNIGVDTPFYLVDDHVFVHARTAGTTTATIFFGGQRSREAETWLPEKIQSFAKNILHKIPAFQDFQESMIGDIKITGWGKNPYTCGSYSVCAPNYNRPDPFACGNIIFTGEALLADSNLSPGQMAGAWQAGKKAAALIRT